MTIVTPIASGSYNLNPTLYITSPTGYLVIGTGLVLSPSGVLSVSPLPAPAISNITVGNGLSGGGAGPSVTINLTPASATQFGGVTIGSGLNVAAGLVSLASATTASAGGVRLATTAEVVTGTDNTKAITPAGLAAKVASTTQPGIVQLSDSVATVNSAKAATQTAAKAAYDAAVAAQVTATAGLPKSGGTMTGVITFAAGQTFPGVALPIATTLSLGVVKVGTGLSVSAGGVLSTASNGTVTSVIAGPGLGAPATNNPINTTGTIRLLAPTTDGLTLGGVKQGTNISIAVDGTISAVGFMPLNNPYSFSGYQWPIPLAAPALPFPGTNGQVLTVLNNVTGEIGWTSTGALSSVAAGSGITVTTTAGVATVSVTPIPSITAGNIGGTALIPTLAVNAQGQITSMGEANPFAPFQTPTVTAPFVLVLDFDGNNTCWEWTTNGNTTIQNPLNAVSGQQGSLLITQDPLSTYTITWGNSWKFGSFSPFTGAGLAEVTMLQFTVVAANYIVVTSITTNIG